MRPFWQELALGHLLRHPPFDTTVELLIAQLLTIALEGAPCIDLEQWYKQQAHGSDFEGWLERLRSWLTGAGLPLYLYRKWLYVASYWHLERRIAQGFCSYLVGATEPGQLLDGELLEGLNLQQRQAVEASLKERFLIIAGGPGTGKTFTAGRIIRSFFCQRAARKRPPRVALLAPTGKACVRLAESIQLSLGIGREAAKVEAMTLHSFFNQDRYHSLLNPAPYDLVLVDEASMIDALSYEKLFSSLSPRSSLILMGDPDQLPPVESAPLFSAMVAASVAGANSCRLEQSLRAQNRELLLAAEAIRDGSLQAWHDLIADSQQVRVETASFEPLSEPFPSYESIDLSWLSQRVVLCTTRRGLSGSERVNQRIYEKRRLEVLQQGLPHLDVPVMASVNQPQLERVNGEMGLVRLERSQLRFAQLDRAIAQAPQVYFKLSDREQLVAVASVRLAKLSPAWAMTVHKSQGSEFDQVDLLLSPGAEQFGRSLLYTAATRARRRLRIWSTPSLLESLLQAAPAPSSGFESYLQELIGLNPMGSV